MRFFLGTAAALALSGIATAAVVDSAYTKIQTPEAGCTEVESNAEEGGWYVTRCRGHAGIAVIVSESDLRVSVSYGWNARGEKAAGQTFPLFNAVGDTVEWRLRDGKPFATILRWKIDGGEGMAKGEALVVTQLDEGNQCWVAMVSATRNADANELARKAADETAGSFDCAQDEPAKIYGTPQPEIGVGE